MSGTKKPWSTSMVNFLLIKDDIWHSLCFLTAVFLRISTSRRRSAASKQEKSESSRRKMKEKSVTVNESEYKNITNLLYKLCCKVKIPKTVTKKITKNTKKIRKITFCIFLHKSQKITFWPLFLQLLKLENTQSQYKKQKILAIFSNIFITFFLEFFKINQKNLKEKYTLFFSFNKNQKYNNKIQ